MAPTTRTQRNNNEVIVLDSDSDSDNAKSKALGRGSGSNKRQKTMEIPVDEDIIMMDAPPTPPASVAHSSSITNGHLKGRKRFIADFGDLRAQGLELGGFAFSKIRPGEDEGNIDLVVVDRSKDDERLAGFTMAVTDTSEYPKHHTMMSWSDDTDLPERVNEAISGIVTGPSLPIADTLERFLVALAGGKPAKAPKALAAVKGKSAATIISDAEDDEDDEDDYEAFILSDDDMVGGGGGGSSSLSAAAEKKRIIDRMQRDFLEIVSSEYRPGLIPFVPPTSSSAFEPRGDFAMSISIPTVDLTHTIPAQALVAWDRRLLNAPRARHLVLLISGFNSGGGGTGYPALTPEGAYVRKGMQLRFQVGVCGKYKPSREHAVEAGRTFGLVGKDAEDEVREAKERAQRAREQALLEWGGDGNIPDGEFPSFDAGGDAWDAFGAGGEGENGQNGEAGDTEGDEERFERFSLSGALENLMETQFVKLVELRRAYGIGWAGAERMYAVIETEQRARENVWGTEKKTIQRADKEEAALARLGTLPHDPLRDLAKGEEINLPYTAFCYLVRRLTLCTRYCLVCHNKLDVEFEALKPYVCSRPLCTYQYYAHNRGASLEYEIIHNPATVDLLVSLCYSAAAEGVLDEPLPKGMALRVPQPDKSRVTTVPVNNLHYNHNNTPQVVPDANWTVGLDGLVDFDHLPVEYMRASIAGLIDTLPPIDEMKRHLERKVKPGKSKPRLKEMENGSILPAAWSILRWCVASCTAYLEEMAEDESIQGVDSGWRQFRFSVGAPDAEAKFQKALQNATTTDANAKKYPSLYAFHGSGLRNWHSIIRHGLWYRTVTNGRAFGDGVYLAKEAQTSMSHYAGAGRACWRKSKLGPTTCVALAEVVNLPQQFVSSHPHFVVKDTEWIMCRYLLIKGLEAPPVDPLKKSKKKTVIPLVKLDPAQPITLIGKALQVPQPGYQIGELVQLRRDELVDEPHDPTDTFIFEDRKPEEVIEISDDDEPMPPAPETAKAKGKGKGLLATVSSALKGKGSNSTSTAGPSTSGSSSAPVGPPADDWRHDPDYVQRTVDLLMPPPFESSPSSTMAVQRELKAMLKEQEKALTSRGGLKELGWYMPEAFIGDNLFQWIVEMHSFDPELPIARDLRRQGVNSLIFEIRFPPTYPIGPPFFRIITPRFLPFIQGGGGHVTGGGSICMDLLTSDGWLPSYSISAVLMQIKLAISNIDPRPAQLAHNWNSPYSVSEALAGFKRAAATHNWTVPEGLDKLVR
ncbi:ubiquitin-CONJUGAT-2 domain-containing protein [Favolaschia claudopus]|uniref:Ubiquitin-CONJUGAT-2 domain-containing protein n=1 Tax=Favolaschia claudopus TaxID=2862362 RepID=A0AAW0BQU7_9AGAR